MLFVALNFKVQPSSLVVRHATDMHGSSYAKHTVFLTPFENLSQRGKNKTKPLKQNEKKLSAFVKTTAGYFSRKSVDLERFLYKFSKTN